ncbi:hypothetical protein [Ruegeria sp. HKCCD7318]|uniref:hypothetical protein n=1 Tax=Ruegeria sp. HKCCD7318 TaxID=2683014 RepID=UPI0014915AA2|nr:hypothetical protein [Ruegeria sp. HKCCD7318]NOE36222.1 hypothetical protein [Ruegeria sp. HKCCD7318]
MTVLITPAAKRVHNLRRAAKKKSKELSEPIKPCLDQIAFEELKRIDKILLTSHVTRRQGSGKDTTIEHFLPNDCWELLMSECWTLDAEARELRSNPPQIDRGQKTRRPPMVISWAMSLPESDTVPELAIDHGRSSKRGTLDILPTIERRGPGDYPIIIHVGEEQNYYVHLSDAQTALLQSDCDIERGAGLIALASDMRQRSKDISKTLVVDDRADLEMQCADLDRWDKATCLFMQGPLDGVPGFLAAYIMEPILHPEEPCVDVLSLNDKGIFSIAKLSLLVWNSIIAGVSDSPALREDKSGNPVSIPICGHEFCQLRKAVFHARYTGPRYIYEEPAWIIDRVPSPVMDTVAAITDGEREGWIMPGLFEFV